MEQQQKQTHVEQLREQVQTLLKSISERVEKPALHQED